MYSFNFTSRGSDEEKLTTELGLLSKFNTELMDFVTKLESFIGHKKNCCWSISIAMFSASCSHSSQNHNDGFLFSLQVEVAE